MRFKNAGIGLLLTATAVSSGCSGLDTQANQFEKDPFSEQDTPKRPEQLPEETISTIPSETSVPKTGPFKDSENLDSKNIFETGHIDTRHSWVDLEGGEHCFIDMRHELGGLVITNVLGSTVGTPCEIGGTLLPGQTAPGLEGQLKEKRDNWNLFIEDVFDEITDGKNEVFIGQSIPHAWSNQIGKLVINRDGEATAIDLFDKYTISDFGPSSCSVGGSAAGEYDSGAESYEEVLYLGSAELENVEYGIGMITDFDESNGAPCHGGDFILLDTVLDFVGVIDDQPPELEPTVNTDATLRA